MLSLLFFVLCFFFYVLPHRVGGCRVQLSVPRGPQAAGFSWRCPVRNTMVEAAAHVESFLDASTAGGFLCSDRNPPQFTATVASNNSSPEGSISI